MRARPSTSGRRHRGSLLVLAATIPLAAGCAGGDDDEVADAPAATIATAAAVAEEGELLHLEAAATEAPADLDAGGSDEASRVVEVGAAPAGPQTFPGDPGRPGIPGSPALAITATATLRVEDVRRAVDQIGAAVEAAGGRTASARVDYPTDDPGGAYAVLTVLVPPDQLPSVVDRLEELGELGSYEQQTDDVTEQLADLDTRVANARASVTRARELLDEAASLEDLVFLEAELTRRETDLELLLAGQATLEDRVAMSTLTLDIAPTSAAATTTSLRAGHDIPTSAVAAALTDGWHAFAATVVAIVAGLAAAAPFLVVLALAVAVWLIRTRRRPADLR